MRVQVACDVDVQCLTLDDLMPFDHFVANVKIGGMLLSTGHRFGLGFAVRADQGLSLFADRISQFLWRGMVRAAFWIDLKKGLFVVFMMQGPRQREYSCLAQFWSMRCWIRACRESPGFARERLPR